MGYRGGISAVVLYNRRMRAYKYKRRAPVAPSTSSSGPRSYIKGEKLVHRTKTHRPGRRRRCARARVGSPADPLSPLHPADRPPRPVASPYLVLVSAAAVAPSAGRIAGPTVMTGLVVARQCGGGVEMLVTLTGKIVVVMYARAGCNWPVPDAVAGRASPRSSKNKNTLLHVYKKKKFNNNNIMYVIIV